MQSTACPTTPPTSASSADAADAGRSDWLAEVGQNLLLLSVSVTATAAVTVLGHVTLNLVG